jgi:FlaA1/EpsC-like NDP-sugar epimerase
MRAQLKNPKFYLLIFLDIAFFAASLFLAYLVRYEFDLGNDDVMQLTGLLVWIIPLKFLVYLFSGLYTGMWRFTSLRDIRLLAIACLLSTMLVVLIVLALHRFEGYSRSVFLADGILTFVLTGGLRMAIRYYYTIQRKIRTDNEPVHSPHAPKVLILGAGQAGEKILREI